jgi:hypothetical protein
MAIFGEYWPNLVKKRQYPVVKYRPKVSDKSAKLTYLSAKPTIIWNLLFIHLEIENFELCPFSLNFADFAKTSGPPNFSCLSIFVTLHHSLIPAVL